MAMTRRSRGHRQKRQTANFILLFLHPVYTCVAGQVQHKGIAESITVNQNLDNKEKINEDQLENGNGHT